jgi:hypothetical protein
MTSGLTLAKPRKTVRKSTRGRCKAEQVLPRLHRNCYHIGRISYSRNEVCVRGRFCVGTAKMLNRTELSRRQMQCDATVFTVRNCSHRDDRGRIPTFVVTSSQAELALLLDPLDFLGRAIRYRNDAPFALLTKG